MIDFFSRVYIQYLDYLLFAFGLFFLGISFLLHFFKRQRHLWMKENPILVIIFYFFIMGIVTWIDLIFYIYNKSSVTSDIHFYIYFIAYLSLFELGRRFLFFGKKLSFLLYALPLLLFVADISHDIIFMIIAFIGSLMAGVGLYKWLKEERIISDLKSIVNKLLYIPFFILSFGYFVLLIYNIYIDLSYVTLHWIKHFIEWSIQLFFGIVLIYHILNVRIRTQFDYQLKESLIKIAKNTMFLIIVVFIVGFCLVSGFGRLAFEKDKDKLQTMEEVIANTINKGAIVHLLANDEENSALYYTDIQEELDIIKKQKKRVKEIDIFFYQNGNFIYGIESDSGLGDVNNHFGEIYSNPSPLMTDAYNKKTTMFEELLMDNESGEYISTYTPILSEKGNVIAIMKIDITGESILDAVFDYRIVVISIILGVMVFIFVLAPIQYFYQREKVWLVNYQNILSSISELICIFDKDGNIIYTNKAMSKITGYSNKSEFENTSMRLQDLLGVNNTIMDCKSIMEEIKDKKIYYDEIKITDSNKSIIPLFISIQVLGELTASSLYVFVGMNITEQKKRIRDMQNYFENTLSLLATAVDAKDKYTLKHSSNVAKYAKGIAKEMKFSEEKLEEIEKGALLHDIGKIYIPDNILKKEGPLSSEEWEVMKKHSEYGKQILEKAGKSLEHLIPYIYYHHERYDGKGYPTNMIKPSIEISIIILADAFEAMSSERSYRKGISIEYIKKEIVKNSGTQFHPEVVEAFIKYIDGIKNIDELE